MKTKYLIRAGIEEEIIKFARSKKEVTSVYRGNDPEDNHLLYYLLTRNYKTPSSKLEEEITELDIALSNRTKEKFDIISFAEFPSSPDKNGFLTNPIWIRS